MGSQGPPSRLQCYREPQKFVPIYPNPKLHNFVGHIEFIIQPASDICITDLAYTIMSENMPIIEGSCIISYNVSTANSMAEVLVMHEREIIQ